MHFDWKRVGGLLVLAAASGCGGSVVFDESGAGDGAHDGGEVGPLVEDCSNVAFDSEAPVHDCVTALGVCEISAPLADGRRARAVCSVGEDDCTLFVDGVEACTCRPENLDRQNVCAGGAPTCRSWKLSFANAEETCP